MTAMCILGNQLFEPKLLPPEINLVFMREDHELCTHFRYHKHKIIFFLAAMRKYAEELRRAGYEVHYEELGKHREPFEERLVMFLRKRKVTAVSMFEIEDKFFERRIAAALQSANTSFTTRVSPMFLTTRGQFPTMLGKKPFMKTFYESQRKRLKILLAENGGPIGGRWSFDTDNRRALPRGHQCPDLPQYQPDAIDRDVMKLVDAEFTNHPGLSAEFWLPTDRSGARRWAKNFFEQRFALFGPYEDAISAENPFVYHSVLTPYLNTGLVTPKECVAAALKYGREKEIPLNSVEGFVRQVIGWREFIRGIYQQYSEVQEERNFFHHTQRLNECWYIGNTGVPPLDDVIKKTLRFGYAHHIERLMVVGSMMLLLEVDPREAHRWFMEMFIDSSDWVMGPNVYGMALFSDGGVFATKPYICGSNYYRKMSGYPGGSWCDAVDGLYWTFIQKHKAIFERNPRMSMMARALAKIKPERMESLEKAAGDLKRRLTVSN